MWNTVVGHYAGNSITTGTTNTCIGHATNILNNSSYSTAIGYYAKCTANNQIMLGTINETVNIPGNLSFSNLINGISSTIFNNISNSTSNLQEQINTINTNISSSILSNNNVFTGENIFVK